MFYPSDSSRLISLCPHLVVWSGCSDLSSSFHFSPNSSGIPTHYLLSCSLDPQTRLFLIAMFLKWLLREYPFTAVIVLAFQRPTNLPICWVWWLPDGHPEMQFCCGRAMVCCVQTMVKDMSAVAALRPKPLPLSAVHCVMDHSCSRRWNKRRACPWQGACVPTALLAFRSSFWQKDRVTTRTYLPLLVSRNTEKFRKISLQIERCSGFAGVSA